MNSNPTFRTDADMQQTEIGPVPNGWEVCEIADAFDVNPKRELKKGTVAPYIGMADIKTWMRKVYPSLEKEYKGGTRFQNNDTLMARITPCLENGKTAFVSTLKDDEIGFGSTEYIVISGNEKSNSLFGFYKSISPEFRKNAMKCMTGSTGRQRVENSRFKELSIALPPLPEQKRIAEILGALDDQIDTLTAMNRTLEAMGAAVFKSWFVDFDGVTDWEAGREGELPKGWRNGVIGDIANVVGGGTPSTKIEENYGGSIPWITPRDLSGYNGVFITKGERNLTELGLKKSSAKEMPVGTVLFSSRAPIGYIVISSEILTTNQGFRSCVPNKDMPSSFLFYLLKFDKAALEGKASGSTFKELSGTALKNHSIVIPDELALHSFEKNTQALFKQIETNEKQIESLRATRDALLPQLVGGRLVVNPKAV